MKITLSKKFAVYVDYTKEESPRPFYVGKGLQGRVRSFKRNKKHSNIASRYGLERRVVFESDDHDEIFAKEVEFISLHRTFVHAIDFLFGANFTRGGEGTLGRHHVLSEKSKKKISDAQIGKKRGPWTAEHRENAIAGMRGKTHTMSKEFSQMRSEIQRKRMENPEIRSKVLANLRAPVKGRKQSVEERQMRSRALSAYWAKKRAQDNLSVEDMGSNSEVVSAPLDGNMKA